MRGRLGARPGLLPHGIRRRLVAHGSRRLARAIRTEIEAGAGLGYQLAEGIALLSTVDRQAKGLHDLGRPDGFHERPVDRWTAFLERNKDRELPGFDVAAAWLRTHRPMGFSSPA